MTLTEQDIATGLAAAVAEAEAGLAEGGIPIGSALMLDGEVVAAGRNQRVQQGSQILHGEMSAISNAGRRRDFHRMALFTTLSPCMMCSGTILQFRFPAVIIAENENFGGNEAFLESRGVDVRVLADPHCTQMMAKFIADHPELWGEDIGD